MASWLAGDGVPPTFNELVWQFREAHAVAHRKLMTTPEINPFPSRICFIASLVLGNEFGREKQVAELHALAEFKAWK